MTPPHEPSELFRNTKTISIIFAGTAAPLLLIGTLIENIALSGLGLSDFAPPRVRSVLVGFCFIAYVLLPIFPVFAASYLVFHILKPKTLTRSILFFGVFWYLARAISYVPLHYFVSSTRTSGGLWKLSIRFSDMYVGVPTFGLHAILFWIPLSAIVIASFGGTPSPLVAASSKLKALLACVMIAGIISMPVPYCWSVYPNISQAVGGGQPSVIYIKCEENVSKLVSGLASANYFKDNSAKSLLEKSIISTDNDVYGPLLLWRTDSNFHYVSPMPVTSQPAMTAVSIDSVLGYRIVRSYVHFHYNKPPHTIVDFSESAMQMLQISHEIELLLDRATTQYQSIQDIQDAMKAELESEESTEQSDTATQPTEDE